MPAHKYTLKPYPQDARPSVPLGLPTKEELQRILASITMIRPGRSPRSERELEALTAAQLRCSGFTVERQKHVKVGRLDILVVRGSRIVIEVKRLATINCLEQLDRYSKTADALVVVCWRATAPFKETFRTAPHKIPIALVELKQQAPMIS